LCFGFIFGFILIGANTLMVIIRILSAELRPQVVEALLMLPKLRHLDNDLEIIIKIIIPYIYSYCVVLVHMTFTLYLNLLPGRDIFSLAVPKCGLGP